MREKTDGIIDNQKFMEDSVLRQHDENPLKPVHRNMVENLKEEVVVAYETALATGDKDTIKRMEWEFSTLTIHKKELKEFLDRRAKERKGVSSLRGLSPIFSDSSREEIQEGEPAEPDAGSEQADSTFPEGIEETVVTSEE